MMTEQNDKQRNLLTALLVVAVLAVTVAASQCTGNDSKQTEAEDKIEATAAASMYETLTAVQKTSKIYTAEQVTRKNTHIEYDNTIGLHSLGIGGVDASIKLPFTHFEMDIPLKIKFKAGIDLSKVEAKDIVRPNDSTITVKLPQPVVELTSAEVENELKPKRDLFAKRLKDSDYQKLLKHAKKEAKHDFGDEEISRLANDAMASASKQLTELLMQMGYKVVTIEYGKKPTPEELQKSIKSKIE